MIPLNFKKAMIEPEKVIAPIAAPNDISIKLAKFYASYISKVKAPVLKKLK